jgi:hypothetical protein
MTAKTTVYVIEVLEDRFGETGWNETFFNEVESLDEVRGMIADGRFGDSPTRIVKRETTVVDEIVA